MNENKKLEKKVKKVVSGEELIKMIQDENINSENEEANLDSSMACFSNCSWT